MRLISAEDCMRPTPMWWALVALAAVIGFAIPSLTGLDVVMSTSIIFVYAILTLSMSYLWGYCGMLSFGQTAMYGVGGYAYAVIALNSGNTTIAVFAAVFIGCLFALFVGYFMIYGRISKIYFTVITLVITVVLEKAIRATSDERFTIGTVARPAISLGSVPDAVSRRRLLCGTGRAPRRLHRAAAAADDAFRKSPHGYP
jgi:ABC-type branched-subunit amino acid transport system permease subunit